MAYFIQRMKVLWFCKDNIIVQMDYTRISILVDSAFGSLLDVNYIVTPVMYIICTNSGVYFHIGLYNQMHNKEDF